MSKEGDVTYEVRADDSKIESDLAEASKKVVSSQRRKRLKNQKTLRKIRRK